MPDISVVKDGLIAVGQATAYHEAVIVVLASMLAYPNRQRKQVESLSSEGPNPSVSTKHA